MPAKVKQPVISVPSSLHKRIYALVGARKAAEPDRRVTAADVIEDALDQLERAS